VTDGSGVVPLPTNPLPLDSLGMWELAARLPEQLTTAVSDAERVDLGHLARRASSISNVVVLGMGGSGIAGDVLAAYAAGALSVPVGVVKSYEIPACVGPDSLVFAVSCSGGTEETLAAATASLAAGASLVVVSSGGPLAAVAEEAGAIWMRVPSGIPQPRAALGALSVPPLIVLEGLGLLKGVAQDVREAASALARCRGQLLGPDAMPGVIARRIGGTAPLVHGSPGLTGVAAARWKTQVNENAKAPAFWSLQPELCHNEIAGWGVNGDVTRQTITLVVLRHADEHPQVAARIAIVEERMLEVVADVIEVHAEGTSAMSRFFYHVLVGDLVSLHLAAAAGVDPGPVPVLGEIKGALRAGA